MRDEATARVIWAELHGWDKVWRNPSRSHSHFHAWRLGIKEGGNGKCGLAPCLTWSEKMRRTTGTTLAPPTRTASEKRENSSPPEGAAAAAAAGNPATLTLAAWEAAFAAAGAAAARVRPAKGDTTMNPRSTVACLPGLSHAWSAAWGCAWEACTGWEACVLAASTAP